MRLFRKDAWLAVGALILFSCGEGGGQMTILDGGRVEEDSRATDGSMSGDAALPTVAVEKLPEWVEGQTGKLYTVAYVPESCSKSKPCQGVILVPDELNAGVDQFSCCAGELAGIIGRVVITWNPPGRGEVSERSEGNEDYGGTASQDALKDVLKWYKKKKWIAPEGFGVVSVGFGLAMAAGAITRFHATNLNFVAWLIDIEGPTNRCFITQSPYYVDPDGEYYINMDGPDVSASRCDFDLAGRLEVFPKGTGDMKGTDGIPTSYICNQNAFVLRQTGKTCGDDQWWQPREAKTWLKDLPVHYLRLQFLYDHVQPTRWNARHALHWVSLSKAPSYQINNVSPGNNLKGFSENELQEKGVYLNLKAGNGFGTDVFVPDIVAKPSYKFRLITPKELYLGVLPSFIKRMASK